MASLLVGGSPGGPARRIASLLAPLLGPVLLGTTSRDADQPVAHVSLTTVAGPDGVTAANQFETSANQDGSTALIIPGTAALAWLAGDPRVHFDAGLWIPALAATAPAVLVGRTPIERLQTGSTIRLAASSPSGCELPAILGLELIQLRAEPIFDLRLEADKDRALRQGTVDALLLTGPDVPARLLQLEAQGFVPLFALDRSDDDGGRDPTLPHIQTLDEIAQRLYSRKLRGPLVPSYRASSAACQLDAAVVLPQLAPAGTVARWRAACGLASASPLVQAATSGRSLRPLAAPECVTAVDSVLAGETALLDLHRFLADRYDWHPV